jgi:outer membrane receptor protein involved in Fe transport
VRNRVLMGLLGTVTWSPAERHDLTLVSMWNQSGNSLAEDVSGEANEEADFIRRTQQQWIQRGVFFGQLAGAHRGLPLDSDLEWRAGVSVANRDEPDTRFLVQVGENPVWRPNPGSGERFFAEMDQLDLSGGIDWLFRPTLNFQFKVGGLVLDSSRAFDSRRFRYRGESFAVRQLPADEIFTPENIGDTVFISEVTQATDSYDSTQRTWAGYGLIDLTLTPWLRAIAGARYESFEQTIAADSPFDNDTSAAQEGRRVDGNVLPSGSLVFTLVPEKMFVRAAYGLTVARPQVREVAPFVFQDYVRRRTVTGNPDLDITTVHNGDLRWEWFPTRTELFAATFFVKQFQNPIESLLVDVRGNVSYANVENATNIGAEFEGRYSFGNITDRLEGLTLGANVALVRSRVTLPECDPIRSEDGVCAEPSYTNTSRPLAGQSPWVVNTVVGYEPPDTGFGAFLYYNVLGPRIEDVGGLGLPDIYLISPHRLDLTAQYDFAPHWRAVMGVTNLLNQTVRQQIADTDVVRQPLGVGFSLGIRWNL